jgi:hypothetical protein
VSVARHAVDICELCSLVWLVDTAVSITQILLLSALSGPFVVGVAICIAIEQPEVSHLLENTEAETL